VAHCPYCKSLIRGNALICKKCGTDFRKPKAGADFSASKRKEEHQAGGCVLAGIAFVILLALLPKACPNSSRDDDSHNRRSPKTQHLVQRMQPEPLPPPLQPSQVGRAETSPTHGGENP
jgi:hypothetical protein